MTAVVRTVADPLPETDVMAPTAAYRRTAGTAFPQVSSWAATVGGVIVPPSETDYADDTGTIYVDETGVAYLVGP